MSGPGSISSNGGNDHMVHERPFDPTSARASQPYERYAQHSDTEMFDGMMQETGGQPFRPAFGSRSGGSSAGDYDQLPSYRGSAHDQLLQAGPPRTASTPTQQPHAVPSRAEAGATAAQAAARYATHPEIKGTAPPSYFSATAPGAAARAAMQHRGGPATTTVATETQAAAAARAAMRV